MTEVQAIEAIYEQWKSGWEALHPASISDAQHVPFTFKGEDFSPDTLGALGAWARISVLHTSSDQITFGTTGTRKFERRGNVFVQLFAPLGAGVGLLARLCGDARSVLESVRLAELNLHAGRTEEAPDSSRWAMSVVVVPFRYTETR